MTNLFNYKIITALFAITLLAVAPASAKPKWKNMGDYTADGNAKEIAINRQVSEIAIDCKEGSIIINTIVVRDGAAKQSYRVGQRFNKGDKTYFIKIGDKRNVSGLRISDGGRGTYRISVK